MSTIRTEVVQLQDVRPHPDAERLDLATIKAYQMVVPKGMYEDGDKVVYFEAGTVIPQALAEKLNVVPYLKNKTDINGEKVLVVGQTRLRGEPSFGLAAPLDDPNWEVGADVAEYYGAIKFRPPVKATAGDADEDHPMFPAYTDLENMRSFPDIFVEGEEVVMTEKLHGTNCRVGFVTEPYTPEGWEPDEACTLPTQVTLMAGSRALRRKDPGVENRHANTYWMPLTLAPVQALFDYLQDHHTHATLYGEVFGEGVQSYTYGTKGRDFRAFDLSVDGKPVDEAVFQGLMAKFGIAVCPELYRGPYSLAAIKAASDGDSLVGGDHGREGGVVRPVKERVHPKLGRVVLKYIGDDYLLGRGKKGKPASEEDYTDQ